ncbi:early nodulin-16-like, partial [Carex rostrata]
MAISSKATFLLVFFLFVAYSHAYTFYVGGKEGWVLHPSESYSDWSSKNRFQVNDTLVFKYKNGEDSVLEVNQQDFDQCNLSNPIQKMDTGDSVFKFNRSGPFFFVSGTGDRCKQGQKLAVVVLAVHPIVPVPPSISPLPPAVPNPSMAPSLTPGPNSPVVGPPGISPVSPPTVSPVPSPTGSLAPSPLLSPPTNSPVSPPSVSPAPSPLLSPPTNSPVSPPSVSPAPSPLLSPPSVSPAPSPLLSPPTNSPLSPPSVSPA